MGKTNKEKFISYIEQLALLVLAMYVGRRKVRVWDIIVGDVLAYVEKNGTNDWKLTEVTASAKTKLDRIGIKLPAKILRAVIEYAVESTKDRLTDIAETKAPAEATEQP